MDDQPVIELHHVAKRYRRSASGQRASLRNLGELFRREEFWALEDLSFSVRAGEALGLIGVNGSGKSTTLRILAGLTRATRGSVAVRRQVSGLLTLGEGFEPDLTGEENAVTAGVLAGLTQADAQRRLPAIASFAELDDVLDEPIRTYSDGMRLRLAFAVSVNVDPQVLLVDELLAVGDLRFQRKLPRPPRSAARRWSGGGALVPRPHPDRALLPASGMAGRWPSPSRGRGDRGRRALPGSRPGRDVCRGRQRGGHAAPREPAGRDPRRSVGRHRAHDPYRRIPRRRDRLAGSRAGGGLHLRRQHPRPRGTAVRRRQHARRWSVRRSPVRNRDSTPAGRPARSGRRRVPTSARGSTRRTGRTRTIICGASSSSKSMAWGLRAS